MKTIIQVTVLCLSLLTAMSVSASPITGGAGFDLGQRFDPKAAKGEKLNQDGVVYKTAPLAGTKDIDYVLLRLTADHRIHRITVFYKPESIADCDTEKNQMRKDIEKKYPGLGYYAMDVSELFYQGPRTLSIECVESGKENRLKVEYSDDVLGKLNVK